MPTLENAKLDSGLYCMFKGEPGTRKSTQALTFPTPQYWFSWDQKMEALLLPAKLWGIDFKQISFDDYNDWNKAQVKLEQLQTNCPYKTLVFDSITSCGDYINAQTLKLKSGTTTQSGSEAGKRIAGIPVNTQEDFNAETSALQTLIRLSKDICKFHKVNIILIAHVIQDEQVRSGNTVISRSIVTGGRKIAKKIPALCTEVYHFNIKPGGFGAEGQYSLLTKHTGDDFARTSLPLDKEIIFGDNKLYDQYIVPAIKKFNDLPQVVRL